MDEYAYGIIPLQQRHGEWMVFLIQHRAGHWGFPKGHAESGETSQQTAARELEEETGLTVVSYLSETPFIENYDFFFQKKRIHKTVLYFLAEVTGKVILQEAEIQNGQWFSFSKALEQITFPEGKWMCDQVNQFLNAN
jgi:8-oxo-dGTP pyrophosphatase MutT (NUDIX family)